MLFYFVEYVNKSFVRYCKTHVDKVSSPKMSHTWIKFNDPKLSKLEPTIQSTDLLLSIYIYLNIGCIYRIRVRKIMQNIVMTVKIYLNNKIIIKFTVWVII